jgi:hypothetical protein
MLEVVTCGEVMLRLRPPGFYHLQNDTRAPS